MELHDGWSTNHMNVLLVWYCNGLKVGATVCIKYTNEIYGEIYVKVLETASKGVSNRQGSLRTNDWIQTIRSLVGYYNVMGR